MTNSYDKAVHDLTGACDSWMQALKASHAGTTGGTSESRREVVNQEGHGRLAGEAQCRRND
jgi:hypothetical protein